MRALRITVTCSELGARCVAVAAHAAKGVHLNEVDCPVGSAAQLLHIDIEGELPVQKLEHLVGMLRIPDVEPGADVAALCREVELHADGLAVSILRIGIGIIILLEVLQHRGQIGTLKICGDYRGNLPVPSIECIEANVKKRLPHRHHHHRRRHHRRSCQTSATHDQKASQQIETQVVEW